ncbi:MAG: LysR family transcriptional regulator [Burkholderiales bacterium]|nr:LysR family transcriptional regulator [Burkholderiales bacterium]
MNIKQLRCICAVARNGLNVSHAAAALHTSQPGVSMQVQRLEAELGLEIFVRRNRRLVDITPDGQAVIERSERALIEIDGIREIGREHLRDESGTLVVAASHGQACHTLPLVMRCFSDAYPRVRLSVKHGTRQQVADMLVSGEAQLGVMSDVEDLADRLALIECRRYRRLVLVPLRHPLLRRSTLTLSMLAEYPLVVYEPSLPCGSVVGVFATNGVALRRMLRAPNSDIMKAYVEQGLGISVLPEFVFDPRRDRKLRAIDASHLFMPSVAYVLLHRKQYLRGYAYAFMEMISPTITRAVVQRALR